MWALFCNLLAFSWHVGHERSSFRAVRRMCGSACNVYPSATRWAIWLSVAWVTLSSIGLGACSRRNEPTRIEPSLTIPDAPQGLVATVAIKHAQASWQVLLAEMDGSYLFPRSLSVLLTSALGLPLAQADDLDLDGPAYGAAITQGDNLGVAIAFHARRPSALSEWLAHRERTDAQPAAGFAMRVSDDYLVVASDPTALRQLDLYAARALPARGVPRHDLSVTVPRSAMGGPIVQGLRRMWDGWKRERQADDLAMRAKRDGGSPDFGDPAGALSDMDGKATRLFAVIGDLSELKVDLDVDAEQHVARATMLLRPAGTTGPAAEEIASMDTGDGEPLLALPRSSVLALLWRESAPVRQQSADQQLEGITRVLGERLGAADRQRLDAALNAWARGRGDWLTAGVIWSERARAAVLRTAVQDRDTLDRVPDKVLALISAPAFREPLAAWLGDVRVGPVTSETDGQEPLHTARLMRNAREGGARQKTSDTAPASDPIDVVWTSNQDTFLAAAGSKARAALNAMRPGGSEPTLGDDPKIARAVRHFGPKITFLAVGDANQLGPKSTATAQASPLVIGYGKTQAEVPAQARAWLEVEMPSALLIRVLTHSVGSPGASR